ncbi:MAG: PilZ domain-containing protein [Candidatus Acidiferrum sp.]
MPARLGRLEKRIKLAVPVEIVSLENPAASEKTTTENVCSLGMRVLARQNMERNERVRIQSLSGDLRAPARVVYCQRLPNGTFGIGLQFQGVALSWPKETKGGGDD